MKNTQTILDAAAKLAGDASITSDVTVTEKLAAGARDLAEAAHFAKQVEGATPLAKSIDDEGLRKALMDGEIDVEK